MTVSKSVSVTGEYVRKLRDRITELENYSVLQGTILGGIKIILDGEEPSDFELSFPEVRQVQDLYDLKKEN